MKDIDYHLCHRMEIISNNCCILLSFLGLLAVSTYVLPANVFTQERSDSESGTESSCASGTEDLGNEVDSDDNNQVCCVGVSVCGHFTVNTCWSD